MTIDHKLNSSYSFSTKPCLFIGNGKLSKHFQFLFGQLNLPYRVWSHKDSFNELQSIAQGCECVFILLKDSMIEPLYKQNLKSLNMKCYHFSGSLIVAGVFDFHPLMTFGENTYELDQYLKIPFITSCETETLPFLPNRIIRIKPEQKSLYHAMCVLSGNFSQMLFTLASNKLNKLGINNNDIKNYVIQSISNVENNPLQNLTGPIVRKDHQTIQKNISALDNPEHQKLYKTFVEIYEHSAF